MSHESNSDCYRLLSWFVFACQAGSLATPADAEYTAESKKATHAMDAGQFDDALAACKKMIAVAPARDKALADKLTDAW